MYKIKRECRVGLVGKKDDCSKKLVSFIIFSFGLVNFLGDIFLKFYMEGNEWLLLKWMFFFMLFLWGSRSCYFE